MADILQFRPRKPKPTLAAVATPTTLEHRLLYAAKRAGSEKGRLELGVSLSRIAKAAREIVERPNQFTSQQISYSRILISEVEGCITRLEKP